MRGVPEIHVVVVVRERHEVLCASLSVEREQLVWMPRLGAPLSNDILEPGL
jgi:hypothetical protein